jgi:hypothetical protein
MRVAAPARPEVYCRVPPAERTSDRQTSPTPLQMTSPISNNLAALQTKIAGVLANQPQCFITHPSELYFLKTLTGEELRAFAERHGWRSVRRIGGRQIEFYSNVAA